MPLLQKRNFQIFVDYIPAELHQNKTWEIVYYVKNPFTEKLERKRNRVKPLKSVTERKRLAKRMLTEINERLKNGWNPFLQNKGTKELTQAVDAFKIYLRNLKIEHKDNNISLDTFRTYTSRINVLNKYLEDTNQSKVLCYKLDVDFVQEFLNNIRYTKKRTARTRDNYMTFLNTLCVWMIKNKYLVANPCETFSKINKKSKNRIIIPSDERERIFEYYRKTNINYLVFCMTCYYCLARRTELSKVKVGDVNLKNSTLFISAADSKNNKSAHVTIPPNLSILLKEHVKNSNETDYLFSNDNYKPGAKRFLPNKSTSNWARMRKKIGVDSRIKWYSLKDSGITDLIIAGVPLISVRDQARHHSIKQTDEYTPRNMKKADTHILQSGVAFN